MIDPYVLARIEGLQLRVQFVAEEVLQGIHRSRNRGVNIEFAEHKEYTPGDELRHIDWRAFARRDKYSIKRFEEDTQVRAYLLLDQSRSMNYIGSYIGNDVGNDRGKASGSQGGLNKFSYAQVLAGSLAYLLLHQRDQVSVAALGEDLTHFVPPRASFSHLHTIIQEMESIQTSQITNLVKPLLSFAHKLNHRSLILLFSDLFVGRESLISTLRLLRGGHHDLVVFHVLDRWEIDFPFHDLTRFEDLESDTKLAVDGRSIRKQYLKEFQDFLQEVRQACLQEQIDYHLVVTDQPPDEVLRRFIHLHQS